MGNTPSRRTHSKFAQWNGKIEQNKMATRCKTINTFELNREKKSVQNTVAQAPLLVYNSNSFYFGRCHIILTFWNWICCKLFEKLMCNLSISVNLLRILFLSQESSLLHAYSQIISIKYTIEQLYDIWTVWTEINSNKYIWIMWMTLWMTPTNWCLRLKIPNILYTFQTYFQP